MRRPRRRHLGRLARLAGFRGGNGAGSGTPGMPPAPEPVAGSGRLQGSRALVTGGARGIGRAIGEALLREGAEVVAVDRDWEHERDGFAALGGTAVTADLASVDPEQLAGELLAEHGVFDRIVNNVGVTTTHSFLELDAVTYDRVMATNLRTPWLMTRRLIAALVAAERRGAVLFTSSLHSRISRPYPHYSASKAAAVMLVRETAVELAPHGIRVNAISPGWIDARTPPPDGSFERRYEAVIPAGRRGVPADLVPIALALLDDSVSGYVTGVDVPVDGGLGLHSWMHDLL